MTMGRMMCWLGVVVVEDCDVVVIIHVLVDV